MEDVSAKDEGSRARSESKQEAAISNEEASKCGADEVHYPKRFRLFCLTIGLMALVLMVALDNYILGKAHGSFLRSRSYSLITRS